MCTYLAKRGSTYYFRRAVPAELRPSLGGRVEFMLTLKTKDREEAKRRIPAHTLATDKLLSQAAAESATACPDNATAESPSEAPPPREPTQGEREAQAFAEALERERVGRYDGRGETRADLRRKLATFRSVELSMSEQAMRDLLRERDDAIAHVTATLAANEHARLAAALPSAITSSSSSAKFPKAMLDTDVVNLWAAERKPVPKGIDTHRAVAAWFYERVGRKPVAEITRQDVLSFKAKLLEEGTTPANTGVKLSRLRTLLKWAADNGYAESNAAEGVTIKDSAKAKNRRLEFDLGSLNRIFSSPVYASASRPAAGKGEAAYWLPLLALFTGARLEELGQLRVSDVEEVAYPDQEGVSVSGWFLHIREDATDALTLKNAKSERTVPIHPELERLGFLRFLAAAKESGKPRLFPNLRPNVYGRLTAKWGEWFGPYLRKDCAVPDKRMVFHSFRHTFKQYARHVNIDDGIQRQIMGHSSSDAADNYGSGYPVHRVVEAMKLYRVVGLTLPAKWEGNKELATRPA
jgi:integrase